MSRFWYAVFFWLGLSSPRVRWPMGLVLGALLLYWMLTL